MKAYIAYLNQLVQHVEDEFAEFQSQINWYHPYKSAIVDEKRHELMQVLENQNTWLFKQTKPYINSISKGCLFCGKGKW